MIPKGGKYAKSVVNFVHKFPKNWVKFESAIKQITDLLKQGKLKLDGKQKTNFEANKNILKVREKVIKDAGEHMKKEFSSYTKTKEDLFKGWTPEVLTGGKKFPPERLYTKEMEAIDEELNELMHYGKYDHLPAAERNALLDKLQTEMNELIKVAMNKDLTKLSLGEINKKSHDLQKRIRKIAEDPNIKGTVSQGPKRDMIDDLFKSENIALKNARTIIEQKNVKKKYGTKFPILDPENNSFIIIGLDNRGNPIKVSRFSGRFSATTDSKTGELTRKDGTSYYDTWDPKKNQMRKEGEEVFHETLDAEGKTIMSNPDYKLPEIKNMEIWNELYSDTSISDLAKKGFTLKDIDMLVKGRKAKKYVDSIKSSDHNINLHERTASSEIGDVMEDLYHRGDDVYKMSIEEWVKKIPEYFAEGGKVPGFATGGVSNLFRQRYRDAGSVIKLAKGARWLLRMLKEMSDDMIFGHGKFANMAEALKMKYFKQTEAAIKSLESGGPIPDEILTSLRQDKRFQGLTVSTKADKDFIEMYEVVVGKSPKSKGEIIEGKAVEEIGAGEKLIEGKVVDEKVELFGFMNDLPKELQHKVALLPIEQQLPLLRKFKKLLMLIKQETSRRVLM